MQGNEYRPTVGSVSLSGPLVCEALMCSCVLHYVLGGGERKTVDSGGLVGRCEAAECRVLEKWRW